MVSNYVGDGKVITVAIASKASGDAAVKGQIAGVCLTGTDAAGNVALATCGVFWLPVFGQGSGAPQPIAIGDIVYWDINLLNKDATNGIFFGYALDPVTSGATTTIRVSVGCK